MNRNYQKELDNIISDIVSSNTKPSLLLHACCAPCSSYCLEYLSEYFSITIYYYNPNIINQDEYLKRVNELKRLIEYMPCKNAVKLIEAEYDPESFYNIAMGLENAPEGGERCYKCYELRMRSAAKLAKDGGYDYFTTTLSISPHKNALWLNEIGESLADEYMIHHLPSDFKKKNGFKRSIELSNEYNLYRQNFCGCVYSKRDVIHINETKY